MKNEKIRQRGAIPILILVALAVSAMIGGLLGYQLGDGTFFSFGVGVGIVLISAKIFGPYIKEWIRVFKDRP